MLYVLYRGDYRFSPPGPEGDSPGCSPSPIQGLCFSRLFRPWLRGSPYGVSRRGQRAYKTLLELGDRLARRHGGRVEGTVSWEEREGWLWLAAPTLSLSDQEARLLAAAEGCRVDIFPQDGEMLLFAAVELFVPRS